MPGPSGGLRSFLKGDSVAVKTTRLALPHLVFVAGVIGYAVVGAAAFHFLEASQDDARRNASLRLLRNHTLHFLRELQARKAPESLEELDEQGAFRELLQAYERAFALQGLKARDVLAAGEPESRWGFLKSLLFTFTLITTIGYGEVTAETMAGRAFSMAYGLIGIPMTMLAIANIGKFMEEGYVGLHRRLKRLCTRRRRSAMEVNMYDAGGVTVASLLVAFVVYVFVGAFTIPLWENLSFFNATYFCFITLTTTGFGDIVPEANSYLIATLAYITIGLAIATLAIDIAAGYLRKIHYFGKQIRSARTAIVWFGAKMLTVGDLVDRLGKEWEVGGRGLAGDELDRVVAEVVEELENPSLLPLAPSGFRRGYGGLRGAVDTNYHCRFIDDSNVTTPDVSLHQDHKDSLRPLLQPLPYQRPNNYL